MGVGLEHLFAGIAQGVGQNVLARQKEERDRTEREQMQQLQTTVLQLQDPNLRPEVRQSLFGLAMKQATFGNKKLEQGLMEQIGPMITQTGQHQMGPHQAEAQGQQEQGQVPQGEGMPSASNPTGGGAPTAPLPSSGLNKFGPPQSQGAYYSPEEQTQQAASRAGAVAGATANAQLPAELSRIHATYGAQAAANAEDFHMKNDALQKQNNTLFFHKNDDGTVTPTWINNSTMTRTTGKPMPAVVSPEAINALEVEKGKGDLADESGADAILRGLGKDPKAATSKERELAKQTWAKRGLLAGDAETAYKLATTEMTKAHTDYLKALSASGKSTGELTDAQFLQDYTRQYQEYQDHGKAIEGEVTKVSEEKQQADLAYGQAAAMQQVLNDAGVKAGSEGALAKQGYTWAQVAQLNAQAQARLNMARDVGMAAAKRFPNEVTFGMGGDNGKYPFLRSERPDFSYVPLRGLPTMPTRGGKGTRIAAPTNTLSVPPGLLQGLTP